MQLRSVLSALAITLSAYAAFPAAVSADTQIGIQGLSISGGHFENGNDVRGSALGAFIEITQRWKSLRLHLEGIPVVDGARAKSDRFGTITQSFGLFNGVVSVPVDRS